MLPTAEPADVRAHVLARTADVLIDELRRLDDLPARTADRIIALALMIRDGADALTDELDPLSREIPEPQSGPAALQVPILDGSNIVPFERP